MKISILTATYNRGKYLTNLYSSILKNINENIFIEWLIMDDGSTDKTKDIVNNFLTENNNLNLQIKYYYQKNQGKMTALNNLINYLSDDSTLLIECDSDDYLYDNAIKIIYNKYTNINNKNNIYALVFLKYDQNKCNIGNNFHQDNCETTMFDLYFKKNVYGDKALVYITNIRKQYKYILQKNEKFTTEALMHNKMDKKYNVVCFNNPIMVCEYLNDGYSKNIKKLFLENPCGYFEYFKQLLSFNMKDILFSKRLYIIKHYILFSYLTKNKNILKNTNNFLNKLLIILLYIPGNIKTYFWSKK
jgi:glycosyltransferase involved in cell wall biosynthesis